MSEHPMKKHSSTMTQEEAFSLNAADGYFMRNFSPENEKENHENDYIVAIHESLGLAAPKKLLDVGCMTGFRCDAFREKFGSAGSGFDPSRKAILKGQELYPDIHLEVGVANNPPIKDEQFDCIILGHFLSWTSQAELFNIAAAVDALLADKGILYITDFDSEYPVRRKYHHQEGLFTHKMPYQSMFLWHPQYNVVHQTYKYKSTYTFDAARQDRVQVTILRKDCEQGFADSL
ncbi:methyltransferase domain-containing protein [Pseudodesulfovibrio sp. JC047]|uniref:class I SAM-dependent methyltransferase n=1 Tax=Pseudodesulfovibrio sp. JC047 TaxID=2683199 RepID=UPI0013D19040|nr:class I SAM-dependent methyltransferase [Pseudodesulfovibrio sp. JC047]NDV20640.1 methyltransferase domain-containing protein [Pseudodesulfovibrio sp. JC047]